RLPGKSVKERRQVTRPVMVDVLRSQSLPREFLQEVVLFVSGMVRANHPKNSTRRLYLRKDTRHHAQRFRPRDRLKRIALANQRRLQPLRVLYKVEGIAPLDTQ